MVELDTRYGVMTLEVDTSTMNVDLDFGEGCSVVELTQAQAAHLAAKLQYFAAVGKLPE